MPRNFEHKPLILSIGDPTGIGPEITLKAWEHLKDNPNFAFAAISPLDCLKPLSASMPIKPITHLDEVKSTFSKALPILPPSAQQASVIKIGTPSRNSAKIAMNSLAHAVHLCCDGQAAALITNPISKDNMYKAGFKYPGHTEYLGAATQDYPNIGPRGPAMMLTGGGLRVGLVTIHQPLIEAAQTLSRGKIIKAAQILHHSLQRDFNIPHPKIAMAGLNPHAGENGKLGTEEIDIINPAAEILQNQNINISQALPADTLFHAEKRQSYDAVLAMYHDQGLIPVKTLDFHGGVNVTMGLPIIRTSPDHGTAFDIAGKNIARPDSLISAIHLAREIAYNHQHGSYG